jgi:hypothetical protein
VLTVELLPICTVPVAVVPPALGGLKVAVTPVAG